MALDEVGLETCPNNVLRILINKVNMTKFHGKCSQFKIPPKKCQKMSGSEKTRITRRMAELNKR